MTVREYIGARYVPLFMGDWDNTVSYEPLSIVNHQGDSYTSRQSVPVGIDISKSKSTVAILSSDGSKLAEPFTMMHNQSDMNALVNYLRSFDEPITILMEYT